MKQWHRGCTSEDSHKTGRSRSSASLWWARAREEVTPSPGTSLGLCFRFYMKLPTGGRWTLPFASRKAPTMRQPSRPAKPLAKNFRRHGSGHGKGWTVCRRTPQIWRIERRRVSLCCSSGRESAPGRDCQSGSSCSRHYQKLPAFFRKRETVTTPSRKPWEVRNGVEHGGQSFCEAALGEGSGMVQLRRAGNPRSLSPECSFRGKVVGLPIGLRSHSRKQFFRCHAKYFGSGRNSVSFEKNRAFS